MGSTGWAYFVPYQPDMTKVLRDLQHDVFERGEYEKPYINPDFLDLIAFFDADAQTREETINQYGLGALRKPLASVGIEGFRSYILTLDKASKVHSREELDTLQCLSMDGTGSILDIYGASSEPESGCLFSLSREHLLRFFGTEQQTHDMIEPWQNRVVPLGEPELYKRNQGIYVVLYRDGVPDEIYIEGRSGD